MLAAVTPMCFVTPMTRVFVVGGVTFDAAKRAGLKLVVPPPTL